MDKVTQQNLNWATLSPDQRTFCLNLHRTCHDGTVIDTLEHLYGRHNLISNKEPTTKEPLFNIGDKVLLKGITGQSSATIYNRHWNVAFKTWLYQLVERDGYLDERFLIPIPPKTAKPSSSSELTQKEKGEIDEMLCKVLGVSTIYPTSTLDDIGADSLDRIDIEMRLEKMFDISIPMDSLNANRVRGDMNKANIYEFVHFYRDNVQTRH